MVRKEELSSVLKLCAKTVKNTVQFTEDQNQINETYNFEHIDEIFKSAFDF